MSLAVSQQASKMIGFQQVPGSPELRRNLRRVSRKSVKELKNELI